MIMKMNQRLKNIETGTVVSERDYFVPTALGSEIMRSYNNASVNDKYKFTEKERDTETNYDYFGARYYDSEIGRWLSVDPLREMQQGWTPYHYSYNNPLKFSDPDGRFPGPGDDIFYSIKATFGSIGMGIYKGIRNVTAKVSAALEVFDFASVSTSAESDGSGNIVTKSEASISVGNISTTTDGQGNNSVSIDANGVSVEVSKETNGKVNTKMSVSVPGASPTASVDNQGNVSVGMQAKVGVKGVVSANVKGEITVNFVKPMLETATQYEKELKNIEN